MITIRKMCIEDAETVSRIEQEIFSMPWSCQGFKDALGLEHTLFLVAEEEQEILGYIGMYLAMEEGEITNVAVSKQKRRRGIGSMLLTELKREASNRAVSRLVLEVRVSNASAIRLYEKEGFINCGIRKNFYEQPREDAYIMVFDQ